jgi:hypothetical protein
MNTARSAPEGARPDPELWQRPAMRATLAIRDVSEVYRTLQRLGFAQQQIGAFTGQSQPEVSAIMGGHRVVAYGVFHRIFTGLGVPLCMAGLGSCRRGCTHSPDTP